MKNPIASIAPNLLNTVTGGSPTHIVTSRGPLSAEQMKRIEQQMRSLGLGAL